MILSFLLLPLLAFSHIIQDDVLTTDKIPFSLKTVCEKMVSHESPLIEIISGTEIDCMGKKINAGDFCFKEMAMDPYYLRAYIDKEKKEVVCHSGKRVLFKYQCVKLADKHLCSGQAASNCEHIRNKLARRLDIIHSSIVSAKNGIKQLNCFFESTPNHEKL